MRYSRDQLRRIRKVEERRRKRRLISKRWEKKHHDLRLAVWIKYNNTPKGKYRDYKDAAKTREIPFKISLKEFESFWLKPCWYCNAPIKTIGLDRINNRKGYTLSNLVPCCKFCNIAKHDLSVWQYVQLCAMVALRHQVSPRALKV